MFNSKIVKLTKTLKSYSIYYNISDKPTDKQTIKK
jgi:hypothetical protein